jgi:molybdopterin converting factor small subunit
MTVSVQFFSYFKELTGCAQTTVKMDDGSTLGDLVTQLAARFPKWSPMQKSTLIAVGVDYQPREYILQPGDEVSLFPPVQGG